MSWGYERRKSESGGVVPVLVGGRGTRGVVGGFGGAHKRGGLRVGWGVGLGWGLQW